MGNVILFRRYHKGLSNITFLGLLLTSKVFAPLAKAVNGGTQDQLPCELSLEKLSVGFLNGRLVDYTSSLYGAPISWKVGGNWGSAVATSNYSIFNRLTPRAGVTVSVDIYVNGVKTLTKSVVTR